MSQLNSHPLFTISVDDVQSIAQWRLGRELTDSEIERVKDVLKWGLECWEDLDVPVLL